MHKFQSARQILAKRAALALLLLLPIGPGRMLPEAYRFLDIQAQASAVKITEQQYQQSVREHLVKTPEFEFVRVLAEKMKVRAWLFGGTAASAGHYIYSDLLRLSGDTRFQAERFTNDYTDIFRSTQDLDIAVDGSLEQVAEFQKILAAQYPQFLGEKAAWEARSLRHTRGQPGERDYKEALLGSFDFQNQNTDSNSLAMIELTRSQGPTVTDLKQMEGHTTSQFLLDVLDQTITFYRSPLHSKTSRAQRMQNPEIFSVIRALTKAFQYDLKLSPQDQQEMKVIIDSFDIGSIQDPTAKRRFREISVKLVKHAVNIEYALNELERLGLRKKLLSFDDKNEIDSLAYWINKEPLRSHTIGRGHGSTAIEIFKEKGWLNEKGQMIVTHETNSFLAYESITRATTGEPNVLISRSGHAGEAAVHGDGFYVRVGLQGGRGTKIPIRFVLNSNATLCRDEADMECDFWMVGDYLVVRNKLALKVVPESLNLTLLQYFSILKNGDDLTANKALEAKFKRRLPMLQKNLTKDEGAQIVELIQSILKEPYTRQNQMVLDEWMALPCSQHFPEFSHQYRERLRVLVKAGDQRTLQGLARETFSRPQAADLKDLIKAVIETGDKYPIRVLAQFTFSQSHTKNMGDLLEMIIQQGDQSALQKLAEFTFSQSHTADKKRLIQLMIEKADDPILRTLVTDTFTQSHIKDMKDEMKLIWKKASRSTRKSIIQYVFSKPHTRDMGDILRIMIQDGDQEYLGMVAKYVFSKPHTEKMEDLIELLIAKTDPSQLWDLAQYTFSQPHTAGMRRLVKKLIERADPKTIVALKMYTFSEPHAVAWEELKNALDIQDSAKRNAYLDRLDTPQSKTGANACSLQFWQVPPRGARDE